MNPIENEQVCASASDCIRNGVGQLSVLPKLIKKIIASKAWERRQLKNGQVIELSSLAELITEKPLRGWGEDPEKIKAVLKDDPEALAMFRKAMKRKAGRKKAEEFRSNPTELSNDRGAAYTTERLQRESPDLYEQVCNGELSANAAAIKAGFRKKPSPAEQCVKAFRKSENKLEPLRIIVQELEEYERQVLKDWLDNGI